MTAYYNEFDPAAAHVLRGLINADLIAPGDVDDRSITEVTTNDVRGYTQWHFFAGAGLWSIAARSIGWPDDRELLTGSCPCQPFSVAGKQQGADDSRHLWPHLHRLIRETKPAVAVGEQVSGAAGYDWFDGVANDLESSGYTAEAIDIPACAVDAPHKRNRLYWCGISPAGTEQTERKQTQRSGEQPKHQSDARLHAGQSTVADPDGQPRQQNTGSAFSNERAHGRQSQDDHRLSGSDESTVGNVGNTERTRLEGLSRHDNTGRRPQSDRPMPQADGGASYWGNYWIECYDGKARRTKPGICFLAHGLAFTDADLRGERVAEFPKNRIEAWRLAGNAIVPQVAAVFLESLL